RVAGVCPEYSKALERSTQDAEALRAAFGAIGFQKTDLKTTGFGVRAQYESHRDENGDYRQLFAGYAYTHCLKVEFENDDAVLSKALNALAYGQVKARFGITFFVSDPESLRNRLLGKAVCDAVAKAGALAKAAGVSLEAIQSIDYSWGEIELAVTPSESIDYAGADADAPCELAIEPEDIEAEDTVTVVWEIE
ncbi:MAG: SIMPL domain-containing protein, partial [Clostridia bacterium]|nr:SIMPL domain-containing protein [Clostridia bacterium]